MNVIDVLLAAPASQPLVVLNSGRLHERWSRWSMVAQPAGVFSHRAGRTCWQAFDGACDAAPRFSNNPLIDLQRLGERLGAPRAAPDGAEPAWRGGWIGYMSYEFGQSIEPRASARRADKRSNWPLYEWMWCPVVYMHDAASHRWYRADLMRCAPVDDENLRASLALGEPTLPSTTAPLEPWRPVQSQVEIEQAIARTIEYIHAGDIFQANIARQFVSRLNVGSRELAAAAWRAAPNWYSAYIECAEDRQVLSLSPELFIEVDRRSRDIITRPLKGTAGASAQRSALEQSDKDEAELNMIVDLMRNDLGRVCEFGSVHVSQQRAIESHPTVHHGVATIEGRLRESTRLPELIGAVFPAGSITGAPKIRAMQIIDELEPFARGPYCGSIGYIGADRIALNVAIRTMTIEGRAATYAAGAGIVADSDPSRECEEMAAKTAVVQGLAAAPRGPFAETADAGKALTHG
ncbi:MAG: anthranilate synthase component I family protein [Phycisphaerales bacterium]|nr:anthranilate synthase component I family protein [Phycisphaerales bacterium]